VKIKASFVTNSSSASMIIEKSVLNDFKIICLKHHIEAANLISKDPLCCPHSMHDRWTIEEDRKYIYGFTSMDNFDMQWFLDALNISRKSYLFDDHDRMDRTFGGEPSPNLTNLKGKKLKLYERLGKYVVSESPIDAIPNKYHNIIPIVEEKLNIKMTCSDCLIKTVCLCSPHDNSICDKAIKSFRKQFRKYTEKRTK
jgi:hypothetical protein